MTAPQAPPPPRTLSKAGRALWDAVVQKYELRTDELHALEIAAHHVDVLARIDLVLSKEKVVVEGPQGRRIPNPLLEERRRESRVALAALGQIGLRSVDLPPLVNRSAAGRALVEHRRDRRGPPQLREVSSG